jgi:two-component system response regulator YesN
VTDYLLKPITVQNLQTALQKLTVQLDRERVEKENLKKLQGQVDENRATLRERLLFKLIVGVVSPDEIIETGQMLGLDLAARHYLVAILKIELRDCTEQYDHEEYQQIQNSISRLIERNPDIFTLKRDWGDLILIMKGNTPEYLEEERDILLDEISHVIGESRYKFTVGLGTIKNQSVDVCQSFVEALAHLQNLISGDSSGSSHAFEQAELLKVDKSAVENYLRCGGKDGFDEFFDAYLRSLGEAALKSNLIKNYIFADVVLAIAKLVHDLGGEIDKVIPELNSMEITMSNIKTLEQLKEQVYKIITIALAYRDSRPRSQYNDLIRQAKKYIEQHYTDPDLSLNEVAARVSLSASHFSVVFSQETGRAFTASLTDIRLGKAKELLRMTSLRSADIAYQVGYNDPHYFSSVFKKHTGLSPIEFRTQM